ncbi:MAG: AraC family transcriptional regulator [Clostridia bacterium]|nr:AraC family transcriptional regulator [Clostridia bacterium]
MKELKQRVSYLQGLADGLDVGKETREGRLLNEIIDVLGQFADYIEDLDSAQAELEDYVESINEDLNDLEDEVFDDDHGCSCDDDEFVDVECPKCHEIVCFEADILDDEDSIEVTCPNCHEVVFVNDGEILEMETEEHLDSHVAKKDEDI